MKFLLSATALFALSAIAPAQQPPSSDYKLALTEHQGQLQWHAKGFTIVQRSAKPGGREIGICGKDSTGRLGFLGFLFLAPEGAPQSSTKCRDQVLAYDKRNIPSLQILKTSELHPLSALPVALATYTTKAKDGSTEYNARGFMAAGNICGDLEFYSSKPISDQDPDLTAIFATYRFDPSYDPKFADVVLYGQVLYQNEMFKAAGPVFEKALTMIPADGAPFPSNKVATHVINDQAGMAYGISGDIHKARTIFEVAIEKDPDHPLYYYNLACADAEEHNLPAARLHLQEAFARKANGNSGEPMPDPTKDNSFTPYKSNKEFWAFLTQVQAGKYEAGCWDLNSCAARSKHSATTQDHPPPHG
jgi:tetratricopeptide (TPR) repeat protein